MFIAKLENDDKIVMMAMELNHSHQKNLPLLPRWAVYGGLFVILVLLFNVLIPPGGGGIRMARESTAMQTTRTLALAMFQYSVDNNAYPDGKSSTEVFQKLLDGNYIGTDPAVFFAPMPGKTKAQPGSRLKPENVAYDVTSGIQMNSPDDLPIVFLTGFRITYQPGAAAVSLVRPFPGMQERTGGWYDSVTGGSLTPISGLPVAYKSNNAYFRVGKIGADGMGVVTNATPADFDAHGQTYRQLTPEGVLK